MVETILGLVGVFMITAALMGKVQSFWGFCACLFFGVFFIGICLDQSNPYKGRVAGSGKRDGGSGSPAPSGDRETTGMFYRGSSQTLSSPIYSYRNGQIFSGVNYGINMSSYEATYRDGFVRDRSGSVVGRYRNGYIWLGTVDKSSHDADACCKNGYVYSGSYTPGYTGSAIGCYTGDDEGAAACAIAMLLNL